MKPNFFALAIASGFWIAPHTVAVVYVPGVSLHSPTPWRSSFGAETAPFPTFGAGFSVRVDEFFSMSPVPNYYTAGIGQEWFEVAAGTAINHEFVINHIPFASSLRATSGDPIWLDFDVPFLLGFWLHSSVPEASRYEVGSLVGLLEASLS